MALNERIVKRNRAMRNCEHDTGLDAWDYVEMTGIHGIFPDLKKEGVYDFAIRKPYVLVTIHYAGLTLVRAFDIELKIVYNQILERPAGIIEGQGDGLKLINAQIESCFRKGYKLIDVLSVGSFRMRSKYTGYIVWSKVGFTMDNESHQSFIRLMRKHKRPERHLYELIFESADGPFFWKRYGRTWRGQYDLGLESDNRIITLAYITKRCITPAKN